MNTRPTNSINPMNWNRHDWIDVARNAFYILVGIITGATLY